MRLLALSLLSTCSALHVSHVSHVSHARVFARVKAHSRSPALVLARTPLLPAAPSARARPPIACDKAAVPPLVLDRESRVQLSILLLTNFMVQMGIGMIIVILPLFADSIGLGAAGVGLLVALPQLTKLIFNLPIGHLVDVVGRKPYLVAGAFMDALGQFGTAASAGVGTLVPARLLIGVGTATGSVTGPATMAYTQDVVGKYPEHAGLLLGATQALGFLAFAIGPAIGGTLAEKYGPAFIFTLMGVLQMATVPLKMLLPETLPAARRVASPLKGLRAAMDTQGASYGKLLADRKQIALLLMKCAFLCGLSLILTVVPLHATAAWGASASDLGKLYSFVTLLMVVVSPLAGALADRVGKTPLAIGGALATSLSIACMPFAKTKLAYYVTRSVWSAGEAFLITAYSALALDLTPESQRGARNSLDNQVGDVALLFLPLLFGLVGSKSQNAAFWLGSAVMLGLSAMFAKLLGEGAAPDAEPASAEAA